MLSEKFLRDEIKRMPKFIQEAVKKGDLEEALSLKRCLDTMEWIVEDTDNG